MSTMQLGSSGLLDKFVLLIALFFPVAYFIGAGFPVLLLILIVFFLSVLVDKKKLKLSREEKLLFFSSLLVFFAGLCFLFQDISNQEYWKNALVQLSFISLFPVYFLFKNYKIKKAAVYLGIAAGLVIFILKNYFDPGLSFRLSPEWQYSDDSATGITVLSLIAFSILVLVSAIQFKKLYLIGSSELKKASAIGFLWLVAGSLAIIVSYFQSNTIDLTIFIVYLGWIFSAAYNIKDDIGEQGVARTKKLSVTVIAYNEVDRLGDCLESVSGWADEIIVFDNGSTDGTIELAKKYTDKVFVTDWPGFGKQKQRALDEVQYEWVLSIDADERVTPALQVEIDRALSSENIEIAYRIPWAVTIYNKRLDFGRSGRAPLRLFKKEGAKFSEASVHEKVLLPAGKVGMLQERLLHYTHRNLNHAVKKFNDYAWLWGTERFEKGRRVTFLAPIFHGLWTFFVIYFLRLGMLDGFRGLVMAVHLSLYTFNKYTVLWTLEKQQKTSG